MASLGLIVGVLGFDDAGTALMLAIFALQDSFGTACNVTGDGALTLMLMVLVFFGRRMNRRLRRTLLCLTLALNIFWTAYLFNCFLSDGWVFT